MQKMKSLLISLAAILILIAADQYTKLLALKYLKGSQGISLIPGVLRFDFVENRGAAFGIMQNKQYFFAAATILVLIVMFYALYKLPAEKKYLLLRIILIAVISGAIGNLIDRLGRTYVVDFINFCLIDFPVFNVADCYITCSMAALIICISFIYKEEDIDKAMMEMGLLKKKMDKKDGE